ncbi:hypothetical protein FE810_15050 [Thalassotalea litorea]|uniref:Sulfotransferase family protein n=1 Tax=Thalassotalea litorea TaxID=2020715 RepID=A0A5R9ICL4_9GAMM|nr:hypothetical protein [Thalassotalea litorea]TLU61326.1 hypothetical protein FE810_15050 [Thalassotalea litorea]
MDILKRFIGYLIHLYVSFYFRNKNVYVISGLRRSGNHALINWLANSLERSHVTLLSLNYQVCQTQSGKTILINEVNFSGCFWFLKRIRQIKPLLKHADNVIISLEDYLPEPRDKYIPATACKITVKRKLLNIIASRLTRSIKQASVGLDRGDMRIDERIVDYRYWQNTANGDWLVWDFDLWLASTDYRKEFLKKLRLQDDIQPQISIQGGGSSFTGKNTAPQAHDLNSRWKHIKWPDRVINMIRKDADESLLTNEEWEFISTYVSPE